MGYSCSNSNGPPQGVTYDGLTGGYIGLGIDEFGNFLNGTTNLTTNTTSVADNTATGYGFTPGRIGLRGAGEHFMAGAERSVRQEPGQRPSVLSGKLDHDVRHLFLRRPK